MMFVGSWGKLGDEYLANVIAGVAILYKGYCVKKRHLNFVTS